MKKIIVFLLCLTVLLSLTACSEKTLRNCDNCNKPIPVSANFCEHCGVNNTTELPNSNTETTASSIHPNEDVTNDNPPNNLQNNAENGQDMPMLSSRSQHLDTDWEALQIRAGHSVNGPSDQWKNLSISHCHLKNIDSVSCYWDTATKADLIGVEGGQIVFWGTYGTIRNEYGRYAQVKDFLSDAALKIEPYICLAESGEFAYIWKLQNGYLMIITMASSDSREWYNQYVHCVVDSKNINYLGPLQLAINNSNTQNNVSDRNTTITGRIEKYSEGFQSYRIVLDAPISVEDWDGKHSCDVLYFYEDAKLNGIPVSEYADKTVTLEGTPENYRGGGEWFINNPVLIN